MGEDRGSFVAECFWPDVRAEDVRALDARIEACLVGGVRYVGSILFREDEVVLCQFEGTAGAVRRVAEQALVPFERMLEVAVGTPGAELGDGTAVPQNGDLRRP